MPKIEVTPNKNINNIKSTINQLLIQFKLTNRIVSMILKLIKMNKNQFQHKVI